MGGSKLEKVPRPGFEPGIFGFPLDTRKAEMLAGLHHRGFLTVLLQSNCKEIHYKFSPLLIALKYFTILLFISKTFLLIHNYVEYTIIPYNKQFELENGSEERY